MLARVREALARIRENPDLYPKLHNEIRRGPVRRFPYGVFYRKRENRIEVIAVLHDRRDPTVWRNRV